MIDNFTKEELMNEQWKAIDGYNGLYEVSSLGRVRSKKYGDWRVLKASKTWGGYLKVNLCKDNKIKTVYVHRLVAQAFIPNDDETKIYINHINECKFENKVSNIEWCTAQYNSTYNDLHHRHKPYIHPQPKRDKVKELYDPNLSIPKNLEIFKANGVECSKWIAEQIRKDLGLSKPRKKTN